MIIVIATIIDSQLHAGISEYVPTKSGDKDKDSAVGTSLVTGSKEGYTHSLVSTVDASSSIR